MAKNYKVSYVVMGGDHPGAILSTEKRPQEGDRITLGEKEFTVVEVINLVPPRGDFDYLHVTLRPVEV